MIDEPLRDAVPNSALPIVSFTEPDVGDPLEFGAANVTVAVNVTLWPKTDGFFEDISLTLVPAGFTCNKTEPLAPVKLAVLLGVNVTDNVCAPTPSTVPVPGV